MVLPSPNSQDRRAITRGIIFSCLLDAGHRQESTKEAANDGGIRVAREFTRYISTHPNAQERVNLRGVLAKVLDEIDAEMTAIDYDAAQARDIRFGRMLTDIQDR